jgi:hypothetical protein
MLIVFVLCQANRRLSIKASNFAEIHKKALRPIYKYYQALQFSIYGPHFQWGRARRKQCVRLLLDAARECHNAATYAKFRTAVLAELSGSEIDCSPR